MYILFRFLKESHSMELERWALRFEEEVPIESTLVDFIGHIARRMEQSEMRYEFDRPGESSAYLNHEALPLVLLCLHNRGCENTDGQVRLRREPIEPELTFSHLAANVNMFASYKCIEGTRLGQKRLVVHFAISSQPLKGIIGDKIHSCIGRRVQAKFPKDQPDNEVGNNSEGCDTDESTDEDTESDEVPPVSQITRTPVRKLLASSLSRQMSLTTSIAATFPGSVWREFWEPIQPASLDLPFEMETFAESVYEAATTGSTVDRLEVDGDCVNSLATAFIEMLRECSNIGDFTKVLVPARSFNVFGSTNARLSFGIGVEREVIYTCFGRFSAQSHLWFHELADKQSSIKTMHSIQSARFVPNSRIQDLRVLGALCALMLILGQAPSPFDPCMFQFIVHDCKLQSLNEALVGAWHPEIRRTVLDWNAAGPEGNIAPFAAHFLTYHNQDPSVYQERDMDSHNAIASEMLYKAILGPEMHLHVEWQAFMAGFRLSCRNGFSFPTAVKLFPGGSDAFLNIVWTSRIANFGTIEPLLRIEEPASTFLASLERALRRFGETPCASFASLLVKFLGGSGLPCPTLFDEVKGGFSPIVDLSCIQKEGFRAKAFSWAATGAPFVDANSEPIKVVFVDDDSISYCSDSRNRPLMIEMGKIRFSTCFRSAFIPASHVIALASREYNAGSEPSDFHTAINNWFLCESLNAIGGHTVI
ncbi:hypothetical protein DFH11DRAFT_1518335 [Phellopilus nigrolimitatus]|nr:hypothetical protein DFH11DRAFT_1518335 [Phellopilus nigrolimitatus]